MINSMSFDEEGKLQGEVRLEYDERINPFFGKRSSVYGGVSYFPSPNNVLRSTRTSNGSTNIRVFHYTYDHTGFPITIREGTDDDFLQITYK